MEEQETLASKFEALMAENHVLREDLKQSQMDKDFVWNLWKRLQAAKPDLASVISMVVSREKEKSEKKDQKVLQILEMKDEKIKELREALDEAVAELKQTKERFHDVLLENDELKQKQDERESEQSRQTKDAKEKNQYLSQLVKAYQEEKEKGDQELKNNLQTIEGEKNALKSQIQNLECQVSKLSEDKTSLAAVMETNSSLQDKMQNLQQELDELTSKAEQGEKEHEGAITALRLRETQLHDERRDLQFLSSEVKDKERELIRLRAECAEVKTERDKAVEHIREQTVVIEQMQRMQEQLHRVMADRKQSYEKEVLALQQSVAELQAQCTETHDHETQLQQRLGTLTESNEAFRQELTNKDRLVEELRDAVNTATSPAAKRARHDNEVCRKCREFKEKLEDVELERDELSEVINEKTRRISSLERTLKTALTSKQRRDGGRLSTSPEPVASVKQSSPANRDRTDQLTAKLDRIETKNKDLKKLLELKDAELTEVRKAHAQRQQRYRLLKDHHNLVLTQLRTYENEPRASSPVERASDRALRHHNSDGVWNELAHYKGEYEKLEQERHDVLEELDVLRVQHARDETTIQELKLCLQEEKDDLLERLTLEEEKRESRITRDATRLQTQEEELAVWKDRAVRSEKRAAELEEEAELVNQEKQSLQRERDKWRQDTLAMERRLESTERELDEQFQECKRLRDKIEEIRARKEIESHARDADTKQIPSDPKKRRSGENPDKKRLDQQAKDISMYDEQLKKIAEKILSPSKAAGDSPQQNSQLPQRASHGTQTHVSPRRADFSVTVDMGAEFTDEGGDGLDSDRSVLAGRTRHGTPRKIDTQTPRNKPKMAGKRTPSRGEWVSMKQRILSLTQQVAALRAAKDKAVKALADEKSLNENMQSELSIVLQRLQVSKNTIQTLSDDLKKCMKEKEALILDKETIQLQDNEEQLKRLEEKLKASSSECSRLAYIVKTSRTEIKELKDKLKDAQERSSRAEHDVNQKKTLIEEMKNKLRKVHSQEEREADAVKDLEEKIRRLVEREGQRKTQVDSLKRQLDAETRQKEKVQQQYYATQEDVRKKARLLTESQAMRGQAEMAVSEMEAAATHQLHGLANESQAVIASLQNKLSTANAMVEEFQVFVKTLVDELLTDMAKATRATARLEEERRREQQLKPASQQARDTACSILNMTSNDLEDFMRDDDTKECEQVARKRKEKDWRNRLDVSLKKEVPFAVALLEILLDIMEERLALEHRYSNASQSRER